MKYCICIKSKEGDFNSLKYIKDERVVPLVDLVSSGNGTDGAILKSKVDSLSSRIEKFWDPRKLIFIDHYDISLEARLPSKDHPYSSYKDLIEKNFCIGLVTGLDRDADYNDALMKLLNLGKNSAVALRVGLEEIGVPNLTYGEVNYLVSLLNKYTKNIYLVLDCRVMTSKAQAESIVASLAKFHGLAVKSGSFIKIILTSSSIPMNLNRIVKTGESKEIERFENNLWLAVSKEVGTGSIVYGDYGTVSPDFVETDGDDPIPTFPKVTYTFDDTYWVQRGYNTWQHKDGFKQYKKLALKVVSDARFRKAGFGDGEDYLIQMSQYKPDSKGKYKTGNATTWITAGLNQHISFISSRL